jgi:putative sterol carrier protein
MATAQDMATAPFVIAADIIKWRRVLDGSLDPLGAIMLGKLKVVRGSVGQIAVYAAAAKQLVECAKAVGTSYPVAVV